MDPQQADRVYFATKIIIHTVDPAHCHLCRTVPPLSFLLIPLLSLPFPHFLSSDNSEEAALYHELRSQCKYIAQDFEIMTRISSLVSRLSGDFMVTEGGRVGGWVLWVESEYDGVLCAYLQITNRAWLT